VGRHKSRPADAGVAVLGDRIRQLRHARGLTLKQLGEATSLSHAFLSQVERGRSRPSMTTLGEIAAALGISTPILMTQTSSGFVHFVRSAEAPANNTGPGTDTVDFRTLTGENSLMKMVLSTGPFPPSDARAHPGEEIIYVIEGELEVTVAGEAIALGPGDALSFDCSVQHFYRSLNGTSPRCIVVVSNPGSYAVPIVETASESRPANGS
jgi:transcriptional regulator with XRE-family HTH domain